jgi:hypothetical protein
MKPKKPEPVADDSKYWASPREVALVKKNFLRNAAQWAPRMKVLNEADGVKIVPDHPSAAIGQVLFAEALATADFDFTNGILNQLANASSQGGEIDEGALNFMLSIVKASSRGIKSRRCSPPKWPPFTRRY